MGNKSLAEESAQGHAVVLTDVSAGFVKIIPQSYRPDCRAGGSLLLKFTARTIYSVTIVKR